MTNDDVTRHNHLSNHFSTADKNLTTPHNVELLTAIDSDIKYVANLKGKCAKLTVKSSRVSAGKSRGLQVNDETAT